MSTQLENLLYRKEWNDFTIEYYEGYRSNMSDYHMHEYYEISFIISGDVKVFLPKRAQQGTGSRLVLTRPMTPHLMMCQPNRLYKRVNLLFSNDFLTDYVSEWKELLGVFGKNGRILLLEESEVAEFLELTDAINNDRNLFRRRLRLMLLLSRVMELINEEHEVTEELPSYVIGAISYLQEHYAEKIVAADLAWHLGIGRTTLMTAFKKHTGTTVNNYLLQYRLKQALRSLRQGNTVQVTAEICGFGDANSFIRVFRRQFDTTPMQYIKNLQKGT